MALAVALLATACGGTQQADTATADDVEREDPVEASAEEEDVMAGLDEYLEEEGEVIEEDQPIADDAAESSEDAAEGGDDAPRSTPEERTEKIYALIKAKRKSVANCYKMARKKDPDIGKRIAIKIVINPDGSLKGEPEVEEERTDIENDEVRTCAIDVVGSIEYPAHPKGMETTFVYPFGF